jgi:CubicO group peptidase (beta-lactamase class C family)
MREIVKQKILVGIVVFLFIISSAWSADLASQIDQLFGRWNRRDSPGCALAVVKDGKIVYKKGYGMANLELGVPISPQSVFYIGSVSKQFVAMCVALLADGGKISLDDDIREYVPEMPDYGIPITIRHLIHHSGGIRDYLELLSIAGIPFGYYHKQDVINLLSRQKELNFKPGIVHIYSNSGYFLLGVIVERASGLSLRKFADKNIFQPLGMKNSRFHDEFEELIKNRATGYYETQQGRYKNFISTFDCVGSGGLFTSVEDLYLWDQNFSHYRVGGKEVIQLMHTQGILEGGRQIEYAFGLKIRKYRGLDIVEHSGSLGGYRAEFLRFPKQRFSVIILSNLDRIVPSQLAGQVADLYLEGEFQEDKPKPSKREPAKTITFQIPEETIEEYTGHFYSGEVQSIFQILFEDGKLYLRRTGGQALFMQPIGKDQFRVRGWTIRLSRNEKKEIMGFRLNSGRVLNLLFKKKD